MQLIFLVETNKSCGSDWMYISTLIKNVYDIKGHKLTDVYMGGKTNFGKKQTEIDTILTLILKDKSKELGNDTINGTINGTNGTINGTNGTIKLSVTATYVLEMIKSNPFITKVEISQKISKSKRTIGRAIEELKAANLLEGKTSTRGGKWILK